jgi:hypothetical protein
MVNRIGIELSMGPVDQDHIISVLAPKNVQTVHVPKLSIFHVHCQLLSIGNFLGYQI